jgi:hypothetical protein
MNDHHPIQSELSAISPLLAEMPKSTPFVAPEGYFEQFSNRILAKIEAQETEKEELSPLLQSLKKENPFSVPPAYLQEFKVNVTPKEAKVIPLFNLKAVLKYAAAAAVVGIIATFATLFFSGEEKGAIAKASEETVISADAFDLFLSETASIEEEETEDFEEESQSLLVQMDANMVSEILTEIPENEISTYIDLIKNEDLNMMN